MYKRAAIICPITKCMWVQGYEPKCCALGTPGRKYTCDYVACEKCHRAYKTCSELLRHKVKTHK